MSPDQIKAGPDVVSDFLDSASEDSTLDKAVIDEIKALLRDGKLSKTRLLNALQALRNSALSTSPSDKGDGK